MAKGKKVTGNAKSDVHRTGKRIAAIHHDQNKRVLIPSHEEAGMEADNPVVQRKHVADYPLNPVTTRGQDPELYWMHKYGPADDETRLKVDTSTCMPKATTPRSVARRKPISISVRNSGW